MMAMYLTYSPFSLPQQLCEELFYALKEGKYSG